MYTYIIFRLINIIGLYLLTIVACNEYNDLNGCEIVMGIMNLNISTIIVLIIVAICTVFAFKSAFMNKGNCGCGSCNKCSRHGECKSEKNEN